MSDGRRKGPGVPEFIVDREVTESLCKAPECLKLITGLIHLKGFVLLNPPVGHPELAREVNRLEYQLGFTP